MTMPVLEVASLTTVIHSDQGRKSVPVDHVSLSVDSGQTLCIVGESGSGKSMTALSIMRLIELESAASHSGKIMFKGEDLLAKTQVEMRMVRGQQIAMIFQEPMTALNPVIKIGTQLKQVEKYHIKGSRGSYKARKGDSSHLIKALYDVGIADAESVLRRYPHQLSGGMRQRVMIAMALLGSPDLLIADEPTTALDVTTQAQILELLVKIQSDTGMAILLITHDMAVAGQIADKIAVMYAGEIIEEALAEQILRMPKHPYTKGLMACVPSMAEEPRTQLASINGSVPSLDRQFTSCRFAPRCQYAEEICLSMPPVLEVLDDGGKVACFRAEELLADV